MNGINLIEEADKVQAKLRADAAWAEVMTWQEYDINIYRWLFAERLALQHLLVKG